MMNGLLKGIPGVIVYIDDILVTGKTEQVHLAALEEVHIHGTHCDIPRHWVTSGGRESSSHSGCTRTLQPGWVEILFRIVAILLPFSPKPPKHLSFIVSTVAT